LNRKWYTFIGSLSVCTNRRHLELNRAHARTRTQIHTHTTHTQDVKAHAMSGLYFQGFVGAHMDTQTKCTRRMRKLMYRVVFPLELKLSNVLPDSQGVDAVYSLFAVVVHVGAGPHHGACNEWKKHGLACSCVRFG
jgi:hypothetical protein